MAFPDARKAHPGLRHAQFRCAGALPQQRDLITAI
jgi:hypothetical protein